MFTSRLLVAFWFVLLASVSPVFAVEPHWIRVASSHFIVLTDGDEKQGREVAVRFEQMRAVFGQVLMRNRVNMPLPIDIIAFKGDEEYGSAAPLPQGKPFFEAGFSIPGEDREYFVLDLAEPDSWRAVSREFGKMLLNYNYPPTEAWFDEGFVDYFASLHLDNKQMQIGGDPESSPALRQSLVGKPSGGNPATPMADLLNKTPWMTLPALFAAKAENSAPPGDDRQKLFRAQSWMTMHYLINKNKLAETGAYFGLIENEKLPVEEAIQKAYGMTSAQLDQTIQEYFHSSLPNLGGGKASVSQTAPVTNDDVGATTSDVPEANARALVAEMDLRLPERHDEARQTLETIAGQPSADNAIVHRAVGWDHLAKGEFEAATEEFNAAVQLDSKDPATRYYMALTKYREARSTGREAKGLANMMVDLHQVLEKWPECADGYYMLGWAQRMGGGVHAAMESVPAAIRLAPRNQSYLLEMARVYAAAKDSDAATALLKRLGTSFDGQVAAAARSDLQDLPYLMKYGVAPVHTAAPAPTPGTTPANAAVTAATTAQPDSKTVTAPPPTAGSSTADLSDEISETAAEPVIDKRPIHYLKGKLISVDCSHSPVAVVTFSAGAKTLKLKTVDYKSLALIGADAFSCAWVNRQVDVNYKAGAGENGDLVSLEVR